MNCEQVEGLDDTACGALTQVWHIHGDPTIWKGLHLCPEGFSRGYWCLCVGTSSSKAAQGKYKDKLGAWDLASLVSSSLLIEHGLLAYGHLTEPMQHLAGGLIRQSH